MTRVGVGGVKEWVQGDIATTSQRGRSLATSNLLHSSTCQWRTKFISQKPISRITTIRLQLAQCEEGSLEMGGGPVNKDEWIKSQNDERVTFGQYVCLAVISNLIECMHVTFRGNVVKSIRPGKKIDQTIIVFCVTKLRLCSWSSELFQLPSHRSFENYWPAKIIRQYCK